MIDKDLEKFSLLERVENIFQILHTSTVCKGVRVKDGEVLNSVIPHQSGLFNDGPVEENRAFSNKCSLLCSVGKQCCSQCQKIKRNSDERNKRKLELGGMVHPPPPPPKQTNASGLKMIMQSKYSWKGKQE